MSSDFEIGRVVAVDTAQITIELGADMKALTRSTYEHTVTVGQINSYVILPVGAQKIVGMVTRVVMTEEAELKVDKTMVTLPSARRLMKATMIGSIDGGVFRQGISVFPVLDNPVLVARKEDLDAIFDCRATTGAETCTVSPQPGYCIDIGQSAVFPDYRVRINPDLFFGKHAAILGSTGSGKSCSVATIIQSVLANKEVKNAHFVILDTNGEYKTAFQYQETPDDGKSRRKLLHISADANAGEAGLTIPYWFMNSDEFVRIFRAAPGIQQPVLIDALRRARAKSVLGGTEAAIRDTVIREINRLFGLASSSEKTSLDVRDLCRELLAFLDDKGAEITPLLSELEMTDESLRNLLAEVEKVAANNVGSGTDRTTGQPFEYSKFLGARSSTAIRTELAKVLFEFLRIRHKADIPDWSADSPCYFGREAFRREHLEMAMQTDSSSGAKARDHCSTMLMRIYRLLEDSRFEFLFGPRNEEWPEPSNSLAAFIRDILGLPASIGTLSGVNDIPEGILPFYDRQRNVGSTSSSVVIIDLSLLASEVLENVTALIARLILEFLQRLGTKESEIERGTLPIVLVLEEAQNYIRESKGISDESISRGIFERIAREGRKYGLSLVVASQRPSELSKTVLSQCNSFIVHRLQNPEDLRYFKEIVPGIYEQLLGQLPALAQRNALVLGECVRAPALVYMREVDPEPDSRDPKLYAHWTNNELKLPNVEAVCAAWEGRTAAQIEHANTPSLDTFINPVCGTDEVPDPFAD